jgi:probable phosphoglycerate mutase
MLCALAARWIGLSILESQHLGLDTASLSILAYERHNAETPAISLWNAASNDVFDLVPHQR